jgi:hypothetical protein
MAQQSSPHASRREHSKVFPAQTMTVEQQAPQNQKL